MWARCKKKKKKKKKKEAEWTKLRTTPGTGWLLLGVVVA